MSVEYKRDTDEVVILIGNVQFLISTEDDAIVQLSQFAKAMEFAYIMDDEATLDTLEDWARDLAEDAEAMFSYQRGSRQRTYTPTSHWEASNCEWEQSAQEGYDYGWDI